MHISVVVAEGLKTDDVFHLAGLDVLDKQGEHREAAKDKDAGVHGQARHAPVASNTKPRNTGVTVCADMLAV